MKKISLLILTLCLSVATFSAPKPIQRAVSPGCNGQYSSSIFDFPDKTVIVCSCTEECTTCPTTAMVWNGDATDVAAANNLFNLADVQVANGNPSGTSILNYQVIGESFLRSYMIIWVTTSTGEVEQTVTRNDIPSATL